MRVVFLMSALLLVGAQANIFTEFGTAMSNVFHKLGDAFQHELDTTGVALLNAGLSAGKDLLNQGVQALALNTANELQKQRRSNFFSKLGDSLGNAFHSLTDAFKHELDTTGVALLNAGLAAGKDLLNQGVQALALNTANALQKERRSNFFSKLGDSIGNAFHTLTDAFKHELDTTGVALLNAGLSAGKDLLNQGVQALALNTANALQSSTRELSKVQQLEAELHGIIDGLGGELKNSFGYLVNGLTGAIDKLHINPAQAIAEVDKVVGVHNFLADAFLTAVKSKAEKAVGRMLVTSKRNAFTDFFAGIGTNLANTFSPMVEGVKNLATSAGSSIKTAALGLFTAAKESVGQLGQKLQGHVQALGSSLGTLAKQGTDTLNALKQATGDILAQSIENAKEPLNQIQNTLNNAGATVVNHVAGTLGAVAPDTSS